MHRYLRMGLALIFPPLAVYDRGLDRIGLTVLAMIAFPFGGQIAALFFLLADDQYKEIKQRLGFQVSTASDDLPEKPKRDQNPTNFIHLADGDVLEIIDTDMEERRTRLQQHE